MWDRRKDDKTPQTTGAYPTSAPTAHAHEPIRPAAPAPAPVRKAATFIGKTVVIKGDLLSGEDVHVEGSVEGLMEAKEHRLTFAPGSSAKSNIKAREVIVEGKLRGDVEAADTIAIGKSGELIGNIKTAGITIEDGGYFKGSVDIVKKGSSAMAAAAER